MREDTCGVFMMGVEDCGNGWLSTPRAPRKFVPFTAAVFAECVVIGSNPVRLWNGLPKGSSLKREESDEQALINPARKMEPSRFIRLLAELFSIITATHAKHKKR